MGAFSALFVNRPIMAMVVSIVIVIAGAISIPLLPVASMPDITPPTVKVTTTYPGANASVLQETVTAPIEQQVNGVENMLYMTSSSSDRGALDLTVTFAIGTDPDLAAVLTQNRVNIAMPMLPQDVRTQGVKVEKQATNMVMVVALSSPDGRYDDVFLSNYSTTQVKDALARLNGVGMVQVFGAKDFGLRVWLDPDQLVSRNLTSNEVVSALREQNVQVAAGQIGAPPSPDGQNFQYTVTTLGRLADVSQFENVIVKVGADGAIVRVRDVARVELGAQDYSWYAQLDDAPASILGIYQLPGANAVDVADGVRELMSDLSTRFPEGLVHSVPYDSTEYIRESLREVVVTLLQALALVILVVFLFLQDWRTTLIPSIAIPVSLIGTFSVMLAAGLSINNLSLFGLILAIGIVVDDGIIVTENCARLMKDEGLSAKEAARKSMHQVGGAVVATTLVLLAVFIPTMVMPGLTGRLYRQFAITISVATVFSSLNALTLAPALCGLILRPESEDTGPKGRFARLLDRFFGRFNHSFDRVGNRYNTIVAALLRRLGVVAAGFAVVLALMAGGFRMVPGAFVPNEDQGYFFIDAELPAGSTLERTEEVMGRVNEILLETPGVANVITIGGFSLLNGVGSGNAGFAIAALEPWDERPGDELSVWGILGRVGPQLAAIKEGRVFPFAPPPITGLGSADGFEMQIQDRGGIGLVQMETFANDLVAAANQSPVLTGVSQNFRANVPQLFADVDREQVKTMGIPLESVFSTLQANLGSAYVNDFNLFGRTWRVMVQADEGYRSRPEDLQRLQVRNDAGDMVPIGAFATVRDTVGPQAVNRFNLFPAARVTGRPGPGYAEGQAVAEIERLARQVLPPQMDFEWSGVTYQQQEAGNLAPLLFGLAIVFAFLLLAAQYESWANPLSVMLSVPVAIMGAIAFVFLRGLVSTQPLANDVYMQIGMVLLIAMSAKTAILIVEFAKDQHEKQGRQLLDAGLEAAKLRFRPILMTAFSFVLGVIPLLTASGAGARSRVSLGTAVFGGMLVYTLLGVFFIPALYVGVERAWARLFGSRTEIAADGDLTATAETPA